jgi:hypothetical protein
VKNRKRVLKQHLVNTLGVPLDGWIQEKHDFNQLGQEVRIADVVCTAHANNQQSDHILDRLVA